MNILARASGVGHTPLWAYAFILGVLGAAYLVAHLWDKKKKRAIAQANASSRQGAEPGSPRRFEASSMLGKAVICVTSDGLTVDKRPGTVFSFEQASLGPWVIQPGKAKGTALHLQSSVLGFILGGMDHRIAPEASLVPPTKYVDATLSASEFDELLTLIAHWRGWDVRGVG